MTMKKGTTVIDLTTLVEHWGSGYPSPFEEPCMARSKVALDDAGGLTQYGVNLVTLHPGAWASQRPWHSHEDEFVYVLSGELTLITDDGETLLTAGMATTSIAGVADGHHMINRSEASATYLEIGSRAPEDVCSYPDIDLHLEPDSAGGHRFVKKSGELY